MHAVMATGSVPSQRHGAAGLILLLLALREREAFSFAFSASFLGRGWNSPSSNVRPTRLCLRCFAQWRNYVTDNVLRMKVNRE